MPRYHFHCVDGSRITDPEDIVLPENASAQQAAVRFAAEVLNGEPGLLWEKGQWRVEVTDDRNVLLFTVITLAIDAPRVDAI